MIDDKIAHVGAWGALSVLVMAAGAAFGFGSAPSILAALSLGTAAAVAKEIYDSGKVNGVLPRWLRKQTPTGFDKGDMLASMVGTIAGCGTALVFGGM